MLLSSRSRQLGLACVLLASFGAVTFTYLYTRSRPKFDSPYLALPTEHHLDTCPKRLDWLHDLTITFPFKYARRDIIVNPKPGTKRASITNIDTPLFPEPESIHRVENPDVDLKNCLDPLVLDVPAPLETPVDASHIIFGLSTNLDRLETSIPYLLRWLPQINAQLYVIAMGTDETEPDQKAMGEMETKMHDLGMQVSIHKRYTKNDGMPQRYFSLIKLMYAHRDENTKWIAVIDDDTFFPSVHSLVEELDERDPEQQWYLGAISEEWWAVVRYGMMGFGGAGVFLSIPLAKVLDDNYDDCKRRSGAGAGDMRIRECIYWHTQTKLTHIKGLHQIDMHGDLSGLYESGRLPLSLHHWKQGWWDEGGYGTWFPMQKMHFVADVCGDCFLQRWQFGPDLVLANGYSISTYATGALKEIEEKKQWGKPENTWLGAGIVEGSNNPGWDHYIGPMRPILELEKEKIQYRFLDAVIADGGVRQFYVHLGIDGDLDTLFELFWTRKAGNDTIFERIGE